MSKKTRIRDRQLKRDWRAYQLAQKLITCIRDEDAKRIGGHWVARRVYNELIIYTAIGVPTKSGHPSFVAGRVDFRGKTVLDTNYSESHHDVLIFQRGDWERQVLGICRNEARNA